MSMAESDFAWSPSLGKFMARNGKIGEARMAAYSQIN